MNLTSAQAAKLLRQLGDELKALQLRENNSCTFLATLGEDPETVRPEYDYAQMQTEQSAIEAKIRKLKHTLNIFNSTTVIPEFDITIDEMLVLLPQLTARCNKLSRMKDALPKARENMGLLRGSTIVDYRYANYDIKQVGADWQAASEELARAQTALDLINSTAQLEIEL